MDAVGHQPTIEPKQILYEHISDQDLQEYFIRRGGYPDLNKLTESEAWAARFVLHQWRKKCSALLSANDEFRKIVFKPDEEFDKLVEQAKARKKESDVAERFCEDCVKTRDHISFMCPYWKDLSDSDDIVVTCYHCHMSDYGQPEGR